MKNRIIIILSLSIILLPNRVVFAQNFNYLPSFVDIDKYDIIAQANLKCSYLLKYLKDSQKPQERSTDLQILLVGTNMTKYYSQYALDYNLFAMNYKKKNENIPNTTQTGAWSFEVYRNFHAGKLTVTDIGSTLWQNFIYEENIPVFSWKITNETQTILGYNCKKATTNFRGRDFIAWFTTEIPLPYGPWKFGGLPGLILKLNDTQNNFVYVCNGIQNLKKPEPIKYYKVNYVHVNRSDLMKLYKRFHTNIVGYFNSIGRKIHFMEGAKPEVIPYNPIELE